WDLSTAKLRTTHKTPNQWMENVVVSPDGRRAIASAAAHADFWDIDWVHAERTFAGSKSQVNCGVFVTNDLLATAGQDKMVGLWAGAFADGVIKMWNSDTGDARMDLRAPWVRPLQFSPDGKLLVSGEVKTAASSVRLWDVASGQEQLVLHNHKGVGFSVAFSP